MYCIIVMAGGVHEEMPEIYPIDHGVINAAVTPDEPQLEMPEFRSSRDGKRIYRRIGEPFCDTFRALCWVPVERDGVLRPVILSLEEWQSIPPEVCAQVPVGRS